MENNHGGGCSHCSNLIIRLFLWFSVRDIVQDHNANFFGRQQNACVFVRHILDLYLDVVSIDAYPARSRPFATSCMSLVVAHEVNVEIHSAWLWKSKIECFDHHFLPIIINHCNLATLVLALLSTRYVVSDFISPHHRHGAVESAVVILDHTRHNNPCCWCCCPVPW
jgi:hypothetical protein